MPCPDSRRKIEKLKNRLYQGEPSGSPFFVEFAKRRKV
jgi:hypothetical protein